jgi:hypothetical protein
MGPKEYEKYDKRNSHKSSKLRIIYIYSNNVRHAVTKTFTVLYCTSPSYTSLHFTTLFDTSVPLISTLPNYTLLIQILLQPATLTLDACNITKKKKNSHNFKLIGFIALNL